MSIPTTETAFVIALQGEGYPIMYLAKWSEVPGDMDLVFSLYNALIFDTTQQKRIQEHIEALKRGYRKLTATAKPITLTLQD